MVTRLPFGSKLWRLFSSTMPHPTWFYNTQLGMIHETQAFVQVVMLVWSWSWFVMIFYLLSYLILYWWRSSMIFDLATMLVLVMLPLSMIVGVVDSSNEAGCLGIKMSSWCLHSRFTARNLNRKCWNTFFYSFGHQDFISMFTLSFYSKKFESEMLKILLLTALAPSHQDVLPSLTFVFGAVCSCSVCSF